MLTRRIFVQALLFSLTSLGGLAACHTRTRLRLGIHPWVGYETLYLAEEFNRLPEGIELVHFANNSEKMQPLMNASLDGGAFTLDEVLTIRAQGVPLTIVGILDISAGADLVLVKQRSAQPPYIKTNQRIGFEANQVGQLMLDLLLLHVGMTREEVRLYPIPVGESQIEAWQRDKIDALITFEPSASKIRRLGAEVAYTSRDFPQRIFDVLAIRTDRLETHARQIRALLVEHFAMLNRLQQQTDDSLYHIASRQGISFEEAKSALHGVIIPGLTRNHQLLGQTNGQLAQAVTHLQQLMSLPSNLGLHSSSPLYRADFLPSL